MRPLNLNAGQGSEINVVSVRFREKAHLIVRARDRLPIEAAPIGIVFGVLKAETALSRGNRHTEVENVVEHNTVVHDAVAKILDGLHGLDKKIAKIEINGEASFVDDLL